MPTIAGEEFDRRLCRDSQRPFHVVAAPPQAAPTQAVTKTPASRLGWSSPNLNVQHRDRAPAAAAEPALQIMPGAAG